MARAAEPDGPTRDVLLTRGVRGFHVVCSPWSRQGARPTFPASDAVPEAIGCVTVEYGQSHRHNHPGVSIPDEDGTRSVNITGESSPFLFVHLSPREDDRSLTRVLLNVWAIVDYVWTTEAPRFAGPVHRQKGELLPIMTAGAPRVADGAAVAVGVRPCRTTQTVPTACASTPAAPGAPPARAADRS
jgi:hypothetical protein